MNDETKSWRRGVLHALPRLLYNHNPFYPISAALTLYGIFRALGTNVTLGGGVLMMEMLCGYTALLAVVGFLIARFGRVWDDARTILLIVALLLVVLSAAFDRFLLVDPDQGAIWLVLGGAFAVIVTEGLLWSLRMRLAARYRIPYYLLMGLLFVYPYVLARISKDLLESPMPWAMLGFPLLAAGVFLTLWPAARHDDRDRASGTPWKWPLYPWSLFTVLFVAVGLRSYSLGITFESGRGLASSFSSWFLVPLLLAAAVLLLELALTAKNSGFQALALGIPLACLPLVVCRASCPQSEHFGIVLAETIGSPAQLAVAGMALVYLFAWLRGIRFGEFALVACLALEAVIDRYAPPGYTIGQLQALPLLIIGAVELLAAVRRRSSFRVMVSVTAVGLAAATVRELQPVLGTPEQYFWRLNPLFALAVAAVFNDDFAKFIRAVAWQWLVVAAVWMAGRSINAASPPSEWQLGLIAGAALLGAVYWYRDQEWPRLAGALISSTALAASASRWYGPALEESVLGPGLPWLAWGTAALWLAILVSLAKSGALARLLRGFRRFGDGRFGVRGPE